MGISVVLAATGVYVYRLRQMEHSARAILQTRQQGFSQTLSKQFEYVGTEIEAIAADARIIDSIENGNHQELMDTVISRYAVGASRQIAFYDQLQGCFVPELSQERSSLQSTLEALSTREKEITYFQKTDAGNFITIFSEPVINKGTRIATAYLLYNISKDRHFWELINAPRMTLSRLLLKNGTDNLCNLQTGEEIEVPDREKVRSLSHDDAMGVSIYPGEILLPVPSFPGLYYAANDSPLKEQKQTVRIVLACICAAVLLMTFCVSFFVSRIVGKPLERMAQNAIQIAREPSSAGAIDEEMVEHLEFKLLARAFNQVLASLFAAQEKLKSDAGEEKKRLETELHRAMKMEAIGAMAGGVAHDLNNILSGLVSYPELLLLDLPEESPLRKPILSIQKSGEKAAAIVQDMLTLARRNVDVTEVVNLNTVISDYLKSPEHRKMFSYYPTVKLNYEPEPNMMNIVGSSVHLSKSIMNLISNALEAIPDGGEITLSTRHEYIDIPVSGYDTVNEGDYAVLSIRDNGTGIEPGDRGKIFEPFYTKKKMGRSGTGLGMAVVWGTVKDHSGYIDLESEVGVGTTVSLYFPVTRKELLESDSDEVVEKYMGKGESVLVVDDVEEQRDIAVGMLTRLGYQVAAVPSGEEAVDYLESHSVDILVLDMIMPPGIDGLETYRRIIKHHPGQKAVVASGYSETARAREVQILGAGTYIKKPYLMKNIGPAIRRELDGPAKPGFEISNLKSQI
jgi:signal transduction histidine kinase/CheY-like chemotaxis protein